MNAIVAGGYGTPDVLTFKKVDSPTPKANELLIRIEATPATRADVQMLTGKPLVARFMIGLRKPKNPIPGTGFAGTVEAVGEAVTDFAPGDRVFGGTTLGFSANAEYLAVPADGVVLPLPETMSFAEAACYCDGPMTSYNFLKRIADLAPGQKVLINGASGSLGTAAVQIAKALGAEVTGVCSSRNTALVRSLGADYVIDYTKASVASTEDRFDFIYDTLGKLSVSDARKILAEEGTYLSPVLDFGLLMRMVFSNPFRKQKLRFDATGLRKEQEQREMLHALIDMTTGGKFNLNIDRQYPLEKAAEAYHYVAGGHKKGNVIIIPSSNA